MKGARTTGPLQQLTAAPGHKYRSEFGGPTPIAGSKGSFGSARRDIHTENTDTSNHFANRKIKTFANVPKFSSHVTQEFR